MTQNKESTLLDSIQSEVSREASPMLDFLVKHALKIFLALIALIAVIVVFGVWNYLGNSKQRDAEEALGKILIMPDTTAKLEALEAFADSASDKRKNAALMALARSATAQGQPEKAAEAWSRVAQSADAPIRMVAGIAQANALSAQGKNAEALVILESMLLSAPSESLPMINSHIVLLAEQMGNWDMAIAASGEVIRRLENPESIALWEQRLAYFASKK